MARLTKLAIVAPNGDLHAFLGRDNFYSIASIKTATRITELSELGSLFTNGLDAPIIPVNQLLKTGLLIKLKALVITGTRRRSITLLTDFESVDDALKLTNVSLNRGVLARVYRPLSLSTRY
jgi:hypothetical protein